ncbi:MAG: thiamine-monophosphate kinase [Oleiphilaceae bacterium]|jgi:thiamine-monophosphate kinase
MPSTTFSEFDLIKTFFEGIGPKLTEVNVGVGDDCAVINIPNDQSLCLSLDTMVAGVHFLHDAPPKKIAYRALAAAMSDLAAMGAVPSHFTLSLTLPDANAQWLAEFSSGLKVLADLFHFPLVGGDTTKGPLTIGIQVHGLVPRNQMLMRSNAQIGDAVVVTGTLGDAGAALSLLASDLSGGESLTDAELFLLERYYSPSPRIAQGVQIRPLANACIDISDGLLADAAHIAEKSSVALEIDVASLPLSQALLSEHKANASELALSSGDDYELLFTLSEANWTLLSQNNAPHIYTKIGQVKQGKGIKIKGLSGEVKNMGYQHFE